MTGFGAWQWCVPAILIKKWATVRLAETAELDDFLEPTKDREVEIARLRTVRSLETAMSH
jgi:hypothetical protein